MLAELVAGGGDGDPAAIAAAQGFEAMDDRRPRRRPSTQAIAANPADVGALRRRARTRCVGALVGAVMKATKGQADGKAVTAALLQDAAPARPERRDVTFVTFNTKRLRFPTRTS